MIRITVSRNLNVTGQNPPRKVKFGCTTWRALQDLISESRYEVGRLNKNKRKLVLTQEVDNFNMVSR